MNRFGSARPALVRKETERPRIHRLNEAAAVRDRRESLDAPGLTALWRRRLARKIADETSEELDDALLCWLVADLRARGHWAPRLNAVDGRDLPGDLPAAEAVLRRRLQATRAWSAVADPGLARTASPEGRDLLAVYAQVRPHGPGIHLARVLRAFERGDTRAARAALEPLTASGRTARRRPRLLRDLRRLAEGGRPSLLIGE